MSSKRQSMGNQPLNCTDCNQPVVKKAGGDFVCTGCGYTTRAKTIK